MPHNHHPHPPPPPPHHDPDRWGPEAPIDLPTEYVETVLDGDGRTVRRVARAFEHGPVEIVTGFYLILHALAQLSHEVTELRAAVKGSTER